MGMSIVIDERLPPLVEITDPTRQQVRRISRKGTARPTPCVKCRRPLTPEDVCFADGRDAHRSCAELWNYELLEGWEILKAQDVAAAEDDRRQEEQTERSARLMGLSLPDTPQKGGLWTPPNATPAAIAVRA